jgi:hypothetical protein
MKDARMFFKTTTTIKRIASLKTIERFRRLAFATEFASFIRVSAVLGTAVLVSSLFTSTVFGSPIAVINPSFEIDNPGAGGASSGPTTGWSGMGHLDRRIGRSTV